VGLNKMAKMRVVFEPFVMFLLRESLVPVVRILVSQSSRGRLGGRLSGPFHFRVSQLRLAFFLHSSSSSTVQKP